MSALTVIAAWCMMALSLGALWTLACDLSRWAERRGDAAIVEAQRTACATCWLRLSQERHADALTTLHRAAVADWEAGLPTPVRLWLSTQRGYGVGLPE